MKSSHFWFSLFINKALCLIVANEKQYAPALCPPNVRLYIKGKDWRFGRGEVMWEDLEVIELCGHPPYSPQLTALI